MSMQNKIAQLSVAAGLAFAGTASADIMGWTGKGLLGYQSASGNSESSSLNLALELGKKHGNWAHLFSVEAVFSESRPADNADGSENDTETTAERYGADYKAQYNFNRFDYIFGTLGYDKDLFGGVRERYLQALGYGRRLINTEKHTLSAEVGLGAKQEEFQNGENNDEAVGLLGAKYNWAFSETANFYQNVSLEIADENTYGESVTGVNAKLTDVLALGASYTVKHNSAIQGEFGKNSDKYTAINLTYSIK